MSPELRKKLLATAGAGSVAVAGVLASWHEGRVFTRYFDPAGIATVCEGITGRDVIPGKVYTDGECDALRDKHLLIARSAVRRVVTVPLTEWQEAALIDFTYNVGETALAQSTLARKFNASDIDGGCLELNRWVNARVNGELRALKGLVARRGAESMLCLGRVR